MRSIKFIAADGHYLEFACHDGSGNLHKTRDYFAIELEFCWAYVVKSAHWLWLDKMLKGSNNVHSVGHPSCAHAVDIIVVGDGCAYPKIKNFRFESLREDGNIVTLRGACETL